MKYAIVFSAENKVNRNVFDANNSSPYEKLAIALAHTIRQHSDVDVYCGNFTNNRLSAYARMMFHKYKVKVVDPQIFTVTGISEFMFLRTYTKHHFGQLLLDQYDFIVYLDVDVVMLSNPVFDFDPSQPMALKCTMPTWVLNYHREHMTGLTAPLCYNWVDIINKHNLHLYDFDWTDSNTLNGHTTDVILSNRIANSELQLIEQSFGAYHSITPIHADSIFCHYDSVGEDGSLYCLETHHKSQLDDISSFFKNNLGIVVNNSRGFWDSIAEEFK